jgi:hypothetical protein
VPSVPSGCWLSVPVPDGHRQQTVDDGAQLHQVGDRLERVGMVRHADMSTPRMLRTVSIAEISPIDWDQDGIGVRGCKQKVRTTIFCVCRQAQPAIFLPAHGGCG